jgi:hypothetical protein
MRDYLLEKTLHVLELREPLLGRRNAAHRLADGLLHGVVRTGHGGIIEAVGFVVSLKLHES